MEATASGSCSYRLLPPCESSKHTATSAIGGSTRDEATKRAHPNESLADASDGLLDPARVDAKLLDDGEQALKQCQEGSGRKEADGREMRKELDLRRLRLISAHP